MDETQAERPMGEKAYIGGMPSSPINLNRLFPEGSKVCIGDMVFEVNAATNRGMNLNFVHFDRRGRKR